VRVLIDYGEQCDIGLVEYIVPDSKNGNSISEIIGEALPAAGLRKGIIDIVEDVLVGS
jgi:hypothetical protein